MSNALLSELHDVFPPVEIALPTKGMFYPQGVIAPDADPNHITVGTLGIMDEFKYRDPFLILAGSALRHLINHICGDQIKTPEELCEVDVEALLVASRIASYGPTLKMTHRCVQPLDAAADDKEKTDSVCGHDNTLMVDLHDFILRYGPIEDEGKFEVTLPRVGQTVYLRPTPYRTTIEIMRNVVGNRRKLETLQEQQDQFVVDPALFREYEDLLSLSADLQIKTLLDCIWAVRTRSGLLVEEPDAIMAWIFELPKSDHDVIAKRITELTEEFRKISLITYECSKCGKPNEFNLQMNAEILFLANSEVSEASPTSSDQPETKRISPRRQSRISRK